MMGPTGPVPLFVRFTPGGALTARANGASYGYATGGDPADANASAPYAYLNFDGQVMRAADWEPVIVPSNYATGTVITQVWFKSPVAPTGSVLWEVGYRRYAPNEAFTVAPATWVALPGHAIPTMGYLTAASANLSDMLLPGYLHEFSLRRRPTAAISPTDGMEFIGLSMN